MRICQTLTTTSRRTFDWCSGYACVFSFVSLIQICKCKVSSSPTKWLLTTPLSSIATLHEKVPLHSNLHPSMIPPTENGVLKNPGWAELWPHSEIVSKFSFDEFLGIIGFFTLHGVAHRLFVFSWTQFQLLFKFLNENSILRILRICFNSLSAQVPASSVLGMALVHRCIPSVIWIENTFNSIITDFSSTEFSTALLLVFSATCLPFQSLICF